MKHSIHLAAVGLCWFSFACGGAPTDTTGDSSSGPTWSDPVEVGADGQAADPAEDSVAMVTDDLSYSNWSLQLPTGSGTSPTTISPSSLSGGYTKSPYFYKASDGGQIFMDPQHGITTSGSKHPRTEMRESTSSGGQAAWSSSGTNTLDVQMKVIKVGSNGDVTIGQVFNGSDSITLGELQYTGSGQLKIFYEEAKGAGQGPYDLGVTVAKGTKFSYELALTKGKLIVKINGTQRWSRTPSSGILKKKFYFKYGTYDQTATAGSPTTSVYTQAEVYSASLSHS